jgi:hypothetical protein
MKYFRAALFIGTFLISTRMLSAEQSNHPPTLAVHESQFGIELHGKQRYSVSKITIRLFSRKKLQTDYVVECFFMKKSQSGDLPQIDDTVLFPVTAARATYEVMSNPIKLPPPPKAVKAKSSKKSSKKSAPTPPKFTEADYPREGYIVRLLADGVVVRAQASSHPLDRMIKDSSQILNQAAAKTARHPDLETLLKK